MKAHWILISLITLMLTSCKTASYFDTPDNIRNMEGTLFLKNGRSVDGKITINSVAFSSSAVKVYTPGDKKPMQFRRDDVTGYQMRNDYFALQQIRGGISFGGQYSFMKRLTPADSRIQLFEQTEKVSSRGNNQVTGYRYETNFYMQLPGEDGNGVWAVNSNKFVPNFDEKMSRMVADCPNLSKKIASKEEGYFYAQVSLFREKRADVLLNIIREYNECF